MLWQGHVRNTLFHFCQLPPVNINLLNEDVHTLTNDFINIMSSYSLYPSITKPTRITPTSATLIDNIFTNSNSNQTSGIIVADVSDHLPVFISTDLKVYRMKNDKVDAEVRQLKDHNIKYFKSELSKVAWEIEFSGDDVNKVYGNFINKFNYLYNNVVQHQQERSIIREMK